MIIEALRIMLFGMLGIFVVMGIIIAAVSVLKNSAGKPGKQDKQ